MDDSASRIAEALAEDSSMTVRQVFYRLVSSGSIEKTEAEYRAITRILGLMRRDGRIGFDAIADNTRWAHKPPSYPNLGAAVRHAVRTYRRCRWDDQPAYVEVWLQKDALPGVLYEMTAPYDVPLIVTRGYPSITFLNDAAETIARQGKPAFLFYFGDFDPSSVDVTRTVEDGIREFAPDAEVSLKRVAVTEDQISRWELPSRPTRMSDARAKDWDGGSVEVDAIPPKTLRGLVEDCIRRHIEPKAWAATERKEAPVSSNGTENRHKPAPKPRMRRVPCGA